MMNYKKKKKEEEKNSNAYALSFASRVILIRNNIKRPFEYERTCAPITAAVLLRLVITTLNLI
jgi:hypothetical protein